MALGTADAAAHSPPFTCADAVEAALRLGYRHIDTAVFYQNHGDIAEAIKRSGIPREDIWITSKIAMHGAVFRAAKAAPNRYTATLTMVDDMIKELQTSYIDLVLIHFPTVEGSGLKVKDNMEMEGDVNKSKNIRAGTWRALESLVRAGKVRNIGVSNYLVPHLREMSMYAKMMPAVNQLELHPYLPRNDVRRWCRENKVLVQAYGSIVQDVYPDLISEPVVKQIAHAHNATPAQVALAWALNKKIAVLPKSSKPARIEENAKAMLLKLAPNEVKALDALDCSKRSDCRFPTGCGKICKPGTYYWDPSPVPALIPPLPEVPHGMVDLAGAQARAQARARATGRVDGPLHRMEL